MSSEYLYRPQHKTDKEVREDFVVRTNALERVLSDIRKDDLGRHSQHHLVLGARGMGKSTLFERIRVELSRPELAKRFVAVKTAEENWPVNSLLDFWVWIGQYLASEDPGHYGPLADLGSDWTSDDQHSQCLMMIEARLKARKQKAVLLIDNVGEIFSKFGTNWNHAFREVLVSNTSILLIGGSAIHLKEMDDHDAPYYNLFKETRLDGLKQEEVERMLLHYAKKNKNAAVEQVVKKQPHRIDHLRILTGGVPRTIMLLLDVFSKDDNDSVFEDLRKTLDLVTPLYKHRMDEQSPQKQKVIHELAMNWDGMSAGELATATRLESKLVSSVLNQLVRDEFVLKVTTSTKNHFYQLSERFFNIWYLMNNARRRGPERVKWLTRFFEIWCDQDSLRQKALAHATLLESGKGVPDHSVLVTNAMLASNLDPETKQILFDKARTAAQTHYPHIVDQILEERHWKTRPKDQGLLMRALAMIRKGELEAVAELVSKEGDRGEVQTWLIHAELSLARLDLADANAKLDTALVLSTKSRMTGNANAQMERELVHAHRKLGAALLRSGDARTAKGAVEKAAALVGALLADTPADLGIQREMMISHFDLANVSIQLKKIPQARKHLIEAERIATARAEAEPNNTVAKVDLAVSYQWLGFLARHQGQLKQAAKHFGQAWSIGELVLNTASNNLDLVMNSVWSYNALLDLSLRPRPPLSTVELHTRAYNYLVNMCAQCNAELRGGDVAKGFTQLRALAEFRINLPDILTTVLLAMARKQYNGLREVFENERTKWKETMRPLYFTLLYLMREEDKDSYLRMGKELEEPVKRLVKEVEDLEREITSGTHPTGKAAVTKERRAVKKK